MSAIEGLRQALTHVREAVPCPQCRQYQKPMVTWLKRRRVRLGFYFSGAVFGVLYLLPVATAPRLYWHWSLTLAIVVAVVVPFLWAASLDPEAHAMTHTKPPGYYRDLDRDTFLTTSRVGYFLADVADYVKPPSWSCPKCGWTSFNGNVTNCPTCAIPLVARNGT